MKNKIILSLMFVFFGWSAFAQSEVKIGYTNVEYIITQLPEYASIEKQLEEYSTQLQKQLQSKVQDFELKAQDFRTNYENMLPEIAQDKQEELQSMEQSIRKFQGEIQQSVQRKQNQLLQPVYEKVEKAINDVATANNYTHIFSEGVGGVSILLYASDENDVTDLILEDMGITPKEASAASN